MLSLRAARERERERESSLSSLSSSLKKSFTLIELSIVLLILSLLVGSLLVGRQIVDRAKIQRIIFEFDYYEKAFHQFYDTYRVVPGNLDEKTVKKYAEFREISYYSPISFVSQKIIRSFDYYGAMQSSVCNLAAANFIDKQYTVFRKMSHSGRYGYCDVSDHYQDRMNEKTNWLCEWLGKDGIGRVALASFDGNVFINFAGFHNSISKKSFLSICGSTTPTAGITGQDVEINNDVFARQVDLHNAILMFSSNFTCQENGFHNGVCDKSTGALSSKITSQLDAKIDDGRPGTGRLLATKSGFAKRSNATDTEKLSVCYDKNALDVDKAIYHENSNLKYGCNVIKVMEDVK